MSSRHTRRTFLAQALAGVGVGALPACGGDSAKRRPASHMAEPDAGPAADASTPRDTSRAESLASSYFAADDLAAARELGMLYLAARSLPITEQSVLELAQGTIEIIEAEASDEAAVAALVERVRGDFSADDTVDLSGWVLSRSELELCALCLFSA
jgi:hypothetical protein